MNGSELILDNGAIAELFASEAERVDGHLRRALRNAARRALLWPREAADLARSKSSLTDLEGIGPVLERMINGWFEKPPFVSGPPLIRQEFLTLARARRALASYPEWVQALKGDLHMHSLWSDGSGSIANMTQAAKKRGYAYIAITDHTKALKIANGLNEDRLAEQGRMIDETNVALERCHADFVILKSAEVNLSSSGYPDMDEAALDDLDLVIGAFHSRLRTPGDQTERYLAALRNKRIHILGHPENRIYNYREGLRADWTRIFAEASRLDKAVEIDGYPDRQDLKLTLLKLASQEGTRVSLGTDAHHPWQLECIDFALAAAKLAGISRDRILNFMSAQELRNWVAQISDSD